MIVHKVIEHDCNAGWMDNVVESDQLNQPTGHDTTLLSGHCNEWYHPGLVTGKYLIYQYLYDSLKGTEKRDCGCGKRTYVYIQYSIDPFRDICGRRMIGIQEDVLNMFLVSHFMILISSGVLALAFSLLLILKMNQGQ